MEDDLNENQESGTDAVKKWIQDNLRIIISVVIVIVIAGGIYSYSKRSETPAEVADMQASDLEQLIEEEDSMEDGETETTETDGEEETTDEEEIAETEKAGEAGEKVEAEKEQVTSVATSKETEKSFIESAQKGEGVTHLARRALSDYLEKSADSELTAEHKIYIEDYLRKKVDFNERVFVGTTVEFSKDLVKEAIAESKNLNDAQLKNLHKYAILVPSLS
ncbi:hypothetical protein J7J13_01000 [bacterium]|nr:hypothetical protein [bacterium]